MKVKKYFKWKQLETPKKKKQNPTKLYFLTQKQLEAAKAMMAPHSSTLAWKIPWTEEPGRLQSMGSLRVG